MDLALLLLLPSAAFWATNVDNLVLLAALAILPDTRRRDLAVGFALAWTVVLLGALGAAWAGDLVSPTTLRWLGLAPIGLGVWALVSAIRGDENSSAPQRAGWAGVVATMLATSVDGFVTFAALLTDVPNLTALAMSGVAAAWVLVWPHVAWALVRHPQRQAALQKMAVWAVPFLLIAVGAWIVLDTPLDAQ